MNNNIEEMKHSLVKNSRDNLQVQSYVARTMASKRDRFVLAMPSKKEERTKIGRDGRAVIESRDTQGVNYGILDSLLQDCTQEEILAIYDYFDRLITVNGRYSSSTPIPQLYALKYVKDEQKKLEMLEELKKFPDRYTSQVKILPPDFVGEIIATLKSDEKKMEYIQKFSEELKSGDNDKHIINRTDLNYGIAYILNSLNSDDKKIELLDVLDDDGFRFNAVRKFNTDELKLQGIDKIGDEQYKAKTISTLASDKNKMELLDSVREGNQIDIIISLKDPSYDYKKLELLEKIGQSDFKSVIRTWAESQNLLKIEFYDVTEGITFEDFIAKKLKTKVVSSLCSDDKKLELMEQLDDEDKIDVISSLATDEKKIELMETMDLEDKNKVVQSLNSDEIKLQFMLDNLDDYRVSDKLGKIALTISKEEGVNPEQESIAELIGERTQDVKRIENETRRKVEIEELERQDNKLKSEIETARSKIDELTQKDRLEKSIAARQKELAELLEVLAKLEADREID